MTDTQTHIAELRTRIADAESAANPEREELARLEQEQKQQQIEEQQRIQAREIEWANTYARTGHRDDRQQLDAETKTARTELTTALEASPIVQALAKVLALEERKQIIADDLYQARITLGQRPEPVEHRVYFKPLDAIVTAVEKVASGMVADERDTRAEAHDSLVTSDTPIAATDLIDPMTLPIAERAAHGHRIERYTQSVEGYGDVHVIADTTAGQTQVDDPAYDEWRAQQKNNGEDQ